MDMSKKLLSAEHLDTFNNMENLAVTCGNLEKWIEAEQLNIEVMNIRKRIIRA